MNDLNKAKDCHRPENAPADYCQKLKSGIARLQVAIQSQYEEAFPAQRDWDRARRARSRESGLDDALPVAFLPGSRTSAGE